MSSDKMKTPDELRAEIAAIESELRQLAEKETAAQAGIGELSLAARRGDAAAAARLDEFDAFCAEAAGTRRRLQAARGSVESELATALALERAEQAKQKAREATEILAIFRKRGRAIDAAARTLVDEYHALLADAVRLENLGARINAALVGANVRRAARAAVMGLKIEGVALVPPLDRHSFTALTTKWAGAADQWVAQVLGEPTPAETANGQAAPAVVAAEVPPVVIDTTDNDPNFTIKRAAQAGG